MDAACVCLFSPLLHLLLLYPWRFFLFFKTLFYDDNYYHDIISFFFFGGGTCWMICQSRERRGKKERPWSGSYSLRIACCLLSSVVWQPWRLLLFFFFFLVCVFFFCGSFPFSHVSVVADSRLSASSLFVSPTFFFFEEEKKERRGP